MSNSPKLITSMMRVRNTRETDLRFFLEPWGEEYTMEPEEAFELVFEAPTAGIPEVEYGEDYIAVHGWSNAKVNLFQGSLVPHESSETPIQTIVEEELNRFDTVSLTKSGVELLNVIILNAEKESDELIGFYSSIQAAATVITTLGGCIKGKDYTLSRIVWRICSRILDRDGLRLQLSMSSIDELFTLCQKDDEGGAKLVHPWLEEHVWRLDRTNAQMNPVSVQ